MFFFQELVEIQNVNNCSALYWYNQLNGLKIIYDMKFLDSKVIFLISVTIPVISKSLLLEQSFNGIAGLTVYIGNAIFMNIPSTLYIASSQLIGLRLEVCCISSSDI